MKQAFRQVLSDFLSAILFLVVYAVTGSLFAAAGIAVAVGLVQLARLRLTRRGIEPMQWMSLGLVIVLGSATMLTQNPRFMMIKPTIVHFAVATVMLRRGWMIRYLPEIVLRNVPEPTIVAAGYAWAVLLAALGLANLFIAVRFDFTIWAWFISVGSVGTKLAGSAYNMACSARSCARGSRRRPCRCRSSYNRAYPRRRRSRCSPASWPTSVAS